MAPLRPADPAHDPAGALAVRTRLTVDLTAAVARRADVLPRSRGAGRRLVARRHLVDDLDHYVLVLSHGAGCTPALGGYPRRPSDIRCAAGDRFSAAQYAGGAVVLLAVLVVVAAERPRRRRAVLGLQHRNR